MPAQMPLRRALITLVLLLATLVFLVPATRSQIVAEAGQEYGPPYTLNYGPPAPPARRAELATAFATGLVRDAYVAAPPGVALPKVSSRSYAVVERGCGAMVLGSNAFDRLPPASTTKVVTALVVLLHAKPEAIVNVDVDHRHPYFEDSSLMGLEPGMKLSVRDLLYGLMLPSGNDAAEALARHVTGGDTGAFVKLMNDAVSAWGMTDTRFANPSGLDHHGLYSTAWDLTVAARIALDNPLMMDISTTLSYKPDWKGPALKNGNALLRSYPGALGLKIGFTDNAKETIVAAAERNGRQLIVSVLGSDDRYGDTQALLDWAFANTRPACR